MIAIKEGQIFDVGEDGNRWCMKGTVPIHIARAKLDVLLKEQGVREEYDDYLDIILTFDRGWWGYNNPRRTNDMVFVYASEEDKENAPEWTFIRM